MPNTGPKVAATPSWPMPNTGPKVA
jgi:hypothetical protein